MKALRLAVLALARDGKSGELRVLMLALLVALTLIDYPRMPRMDQTTADFSYIRWLGDRREFPEGHTHLKKNRDEDLLWWSELVDGFLGEGRTVFAYANNHYQNHSPSTLERFLAQARQHYRVEFSDKASVTVSRESLPKQPTVLILPGH